MQPALDELQLLDGILGIVRARRGVDFRVYRRATILRRVRNRMISTGVASLPEYLARLRDDPDECAPLVERLTLKVSRFFRNAWAWQTLGHELRRRLDAGARVPFASWSAG